MFSPRRRRAAGARSGVLSPDRRDLLGVLLTEHRANEPQWPTHNATGRPVLDDVLRRA
jgi:hypothetical protein